MKMSACLIVFNEAEMLPRCLKYLNNVDSVSEICVLDSNSTDGTLNILHKYSGKKPLRWAVKPFTSFGTQRNTVMHMAKEEWIFYIDADETYTQQLDGFLDRLNLANINAIRIPTLVLVKDEHHYIASNNTDPHIRIWRKGFASFTGDVHEHLMDARGRNIHCVNDHDIINSWHMDENVYMKHAQLLKSFDSLYGKGKRWDDLGMIEKSQSAGIPVHKGIWAEWKTAGENNGITCAALPQHWKGEV